MFVAISREQSPVPGDKVGNPRWQPLRGKPVLEVLRTRVQKSPAYDETFLEQRPMGSVMGHVSRLREEKGSAKGTVVFATRRTRGEGDLRGVSLSRLLQVPTASLQLSVIVIVGKQDQATARIVPGWRPPSPTRDLHRNHIVPGSSASSTFDSSACVPHSRVDICSMLSTDREFVPRPRTP